MADENGVASFTMHEESLVSLFGPTTVVGRGVVVITKRRFSLCEEILTLEAYLV